MNHWRQLKPIARNSLSGFFYLFLDYLNRQRVENLKPSALPPARKTNHPLISCLSLC